MSTTAPLISVVIPAHNAAPFLADTLASIAAQAGPFLLQTIVVDDGSTDDTGRVAESFDGVTLIKQPRAGPAAARNRGLREALGALVAFLDADDLWPSGKLQVQLAVLERYPEAVLVFGDCRQFDAHGPWPHTEFQAGPRGRLAWGDDALVPQAYVRLLRDNFITTGSVLARTSQVLAAGAFDERLRLVEDLDLWLRLARRHPIAWTSELCLLRRRHAANTSREPESMMRAYLDVLERQHDAGPGLEQAPPEVLAASAAEAHLELAALAAHRADRIGAMRLAWRGFALHPSVRALRTAGAIAMHALQTTLHDEDRESPS